MPNSKIFLLSLCYATLCSCQFLQPRKFLEKILDLHEQSRNVLSGGDSMKLNVDLSSAKEFPMRDDLYLRVFNKNNNITLCETRLFDHVEAGSFPCSFHEDKAQLRTGANNLALEVYSNTNWKVYATQKIPDIHYFNTVSYEGHYDDFIAAGGIARYTNKIIVVSAIAALIALLIRTGPLSVVGGLKYLVVDVVGAQIVALPRATGSFLRHSLTAVGSGTFGVFSFLTASLQFLYNIFSSGLASPFSMLLSGLGFLATALGMGLQNAFSGVISSLEFLYNIFSAGLASPFSMLISGFIFMANAFGLGLQGTFSGFTASLQFLYDIFSSGLASPLSMLLSGLLFSLKTLGFGTTAALTGIQVAAVSSVSFVAGLGGNSISLLGALFGGITGGSKTVFLSSGLFMQSLAAAISFYSLAGFRNFLWGGQALFDGVLNFPKFSFLVLAASAQFLFDIFYAGLSSPFGMLASGVTGVGSIVGQGLKNSVVGVYTGGSAVTTYSASAVKSLFSSASKSSVILSNFFNAVFRFGFYSVTGSSNHFRLFFISAFQFLRSVPTECLSTVLKSSSFLYDIFSSGLASPCGMFVSGCGSLATLLSFGATSTYHNSSNAFTFAMQSIFKTYKNVVSSCLLAIFGTFNMVGGGFKGITTGCNSLYSLFFSFFKFFRSQCFQMLFVNSDTSSPSTGPPPPKSQLKKWQKGSGTAPSKSTFMPPQQHRPPPRQMQQQAMQSRPANERKRAKGGVAVAGLFFAVLLFAPGRKFNTIFSEPVGTQPVPAYAMASSNSNAPPPSVVATRVGALKSLIDNFMAARKIPRDIPAGCPLRRAGFF